MARANVARGTAVFVDASSVDNLRKALAEFPPSFFVQASSVFLTELGTLQGIMKGKTALPPGPIVKGTGTHKQSGRLTGAWGVAVSGTQLKDLKGAAFSFAGIKAPRLELGATVRPGGADDASDIRNWIMIPTDLNRRPDGRALKSPRAIRESGGRYLNRQAVKFRIFDPDNPRQAIGSIIPPAIIDGKQSPAWNVLTMPGLNQAAFIMVKEAKYVPPYFQFFATGQEFSKTLPPKLADKAQTFWRDVTI